MAFLLLIFASLAWAGPPSPLSPIPTGNGYGFAVYSPREKRVTKLYTHPYRFERPSPDLEKAGVETPSVIQSLEWQPVHSPKRIVRESYLDQTQVISVENSQAREVFYLPFDLEQNAMITQWLPTHPPDDGACLKIRWRKGVASEKLDSFGGREAKVIRFKDIGEAVLVAPIGPAGASFGTCLRSDRAWAIVTVADASRIAGALQALDTWVGALSGGQLLGRELSHFESWRSRPAARFQSEAERRLWRQSETVLRMAQIREFDQHAEGLILGSLPDGQWFMPWVRDMNYSTGALIRLQHFEEARKALDGLLNARPVGKWKTETGGADYQISVVRYFGNGEEEADFSGLSTPNVELDGWGLTLATADEYFSASGDYAWLRSQTYRGGVYESMRDFIAKPLLDNLELYEGARVVRADSSIWEVHQQNKKHFAYTTIAGIHGLERFRHIALAVGDHEMVNVLDSALPDLEAGFKHAFVDGDAIVGTAEQGTSNRIDGSVLEAFNFGITSDPALRRGTFAKIEQLKTATGGYRRSQSTSSYDVQDWVFVDFAFARALLGAGEQARSAAIVEPILKKADLDHDLFPELYLARAGRGYSEKIGSPAGAIPMVSYGAAFYLSYLLDRDLVLAISSIR